MIAILITAWATCSACVQPYSSWGWRPWSPPTRMPSAADRLILPAWAPLATPWPSWTATGLVPVLREQAEQKPLLGICLGMQLLFEKSYEYGEHAGLGFIKARCARWSRPDGQKPEGTADRLERLHIVKDDPLFQYIREGEYVYYVHSYYGKNCTESTLADQRLLHPGHRRGTGGQGVRHPVPPGKERRHRPAHPEGVCGVIRRGRWNCFQPLTCAAARWCA